MSYSSSLGDRPRGGVGAVFALMMVIAITLVAFHVTAAGVFEEQPTVRIHVGSQLSASRPDFSDSRQVDEVQHCQSIAASTRRTVRSSPTIRAVSAGGRCGRARD